MMHHMEPYPLFLSVKKNMPFVLLPDSKGVTMQRGGIKKHHCVSCNFTHQLELSASCFQCLHLHLQVIYISTHSISNEDITQYVHFLFSSEGLTVSKNKIKVHL